MNRTAKKVLIGIALILLVLLVIRWWSGNRNAGVIKVATEKVSRRTIIETVTANGKIYPETEVKISPEFSGQVNDLRVAEGDHVKKGQVLASVGNRGAITSPIDGMVSSLRVKKGETVAGNTFSVGTTMMTISDMSNLELRVGVGENDIVKISIGDSADVEVDAYDRRKFKGVVTQIANTTNERIPGMGVSTDVTEYEVKIKLDKTSYSDLIDTATRAGTVKPRQPFRPGMNASASIRTRKMEGILAVPITAINARVKGSDMNRDEKRKEDREMREEEGLQEEENLTGDELEEIAFVLQPDGRVKKLIVKTGIQDINYIEVTTGLKEGDEVVIGPYAALSKDLREGARVKVVSRDKLFE